MSQDCNNRKGESVQVSTKTITIVLTIRSWSHKYNNKTRLSIKDMSHKPETIDCRPYGSGVHVIRSLRDYQDTRD